MVNPIVPNWAPMPRFLQREPECHNARVARERQAREAEDQRHAALATALDEAGRDWSHVRLAACCDAPMAVPALDLHRPVAEFDNVVCAECYAEDGFGDARSVKWPCRTFTAIKDAA